LVEVIDEKGRNYFEYEEDTIWNPLESSESFKDFLVVGGNGKKITVNSLILVWSEPFQEPIRLGILSKGKTKKIIEKNKMQAFLFL
jgi:hypothetical protein